MSKWYQLQEGNAFIAPRRNTKVEASQDAINLGLAKRIDRDRIQYLKSNVRIVTGRSTNTARKRAEGMIDMRPLPSFVTQDIGHYEPGKLYEQYLEKIRAEASTMTGLLLAKRPDLRVQDIELVSWRCERDPTKIIFRIQEKGAHHE